MNEKVNQKQEIKVKVKGFQPARNENEGIQVFAVYSPEFGECYHSYYSEIDAIRHIEYMEAKYGPGNDEQKDQIIPWSIRSALDQRIEIHGMDIGYQFATNRMGKRTTRRSVHNLRREGGEIIGEVNYLGRKIEVKYLLPRFWVFHSFIGFNE